LLIRAAGLTDSVNIQQNARELFESVLALTQGHPSLQELHCELQSHYQRLHQPMQVAIVGKIKAGKSTMMNALLGEQMVATGAEELTFNVNWLRYASEPFLLVHYKDDRPAEEKSLEELESLTRRRGFDLEQLKQVKYVEVGYPNDMLKNFNLIDTPGLGSAYLDDSRNTLDFLGLDAHKLTERTEAEASGADAILYLFSQSIGQSDKSILEEFQGATIGEASPINTIGVLTRIDAYWPTEDNPLAGGQNVINRLRSEHNEVKGVFYNIFPVSGLLAFGAKTLTREEHGTLLQLARLPQTRFQRLIRNVNRFAQREYDDIDVSSQRRQSLLMRLGQFGIGEAYSAISDGIGEKDALSQALVNRSGLPQLTDCVMSHFGNRAFLIKLSTGLHKTAASCFVAERRLSGLERGIVSQIRAKFEAFEAQQHEFTELRILRSYYDGGLEISPDEAQHLLQITGEYGASIGERLGADQQADPATLLAACRERKRYWYQRANDVMGAGRATISAANALARSYERIEYNLSRGPGSADRQN